MAAETTSAILHTCSTAPTDGRARFYGRVWVSFWHSVGSGIAMTMILLPSGSKRVGTLQRISLAS